MFDLGMTELMVIGVVALIVVGPKDLPMLFRRVGQFVGKARGMAREFSRAMEQAADESGMKETADNLRTIGKTAANPVKAGLDQVINATEDAAESFQKWDPESETGKLAAERQEAKQKIQDAAAKRARERKAKEATEERARAAARQTDAKAARAATEEAPASKADTPRDQA
ncbi:MAG: twin-arginine translocase subunit TatB [Rhodobacterales bacterium]|nr:MAG: twin-arginine translocase subunit TatB [Rhodobacterales bacterium]